METDHLPDISFLDLAKEVILQENRPLTTNEIWSCAERSGLIDRLKTGGKTPKATLGSRLSTNVKNPDSIFVTVSARPAKYALRKMLDENPNLEAVAQSTVTPQARRDPIPYKERDLHPLIACFANQTFNAHSRTIFHEKSNKGTSKQNQWLHPDVVAFSLTTQAWTAPVVKLAKSANHVAVKIFSFELKRSINFATLRHFFFQAVSNSSWANQGYLVAAHIEEDTELFEEIKRLSESFGIGVIQLNLEEPNDSRVLLPARDREELDWDTINRISAVNSDFKQFLECVANSIAINQVATVGFDEVLTEIEMVRYAKNLSSNLVVSGSDKA